MSETPATPEGDPSDDPKPTAEEQALIDQGQRGFDEPENPLAKPAAPQEAQRPEYVPEQFWKDGKVDVEGMAKSYGELRGKMDGGQKPADPEPKADPAPEARKDGKIPEKEEPAEAQPQPLQTAIEAAREEWATGEQVSEETFKSLEEAGIPRPIVESYLKGVETEQQQTYAAIYEYADGEENYNSMIAWAAETLEPAQIEAFNEALDNPHLREDAVRGLARRYGEAGQKPTEGNMVTPAGTPSAAGDVFNSREEFLAAQADPKYATDPVYRQSVVDKLARSQQTGSMDRVVDSGKFPRQIQSMG